MVLPVVDAGSSPGGGGVAVVVVAIGDRPIVDQPVIVVIDVAGGRSIFFSTNVGDPYGKGVP